MRSAEAGGAQGDGFDPRWHDPKRRATGGSGPDPQTRASGDGKPRNGAPARMTSGSSGKTQSVPVRPGATQPRAARRASGGPEKSPGRGEVNRSPGPPEPRGLGWWGSLSGGLSVCIIIASAALGAIATVVTRTQPGQALSVCVVVGTFLAALTVRPSAGRLLLPAPALCYVLAALTAGIIYDRSASKTQQAVDAAQWIANGFFAMAIATGLAIVLTSVRWFLWHRGRRADTRGPQGWDGNPGPPGTRPAQRPRPARPGQWPGGAQGPDQRPGRRPDQYQGPTGPRPGQGTYNFSSGA
jgi:hypothetical protein